MKKVFIAFLAVFIAAAAVADVFAPFISHIKATARQNAIVISWQDSKDITGTNIVYRSKQEINNTNFKYAERIAEVPMGKQQYIDYPPDDSEYYYAVLITGDNGVPYNYIIPFRNSISASVMIAEAPKAENKQETKERGNQIFAPFVSRLKSSSDNESVTLRWADSPDVSGRDIIYRYTEEITNENLTRADKITEIPSGTETYTDYPPDIKDYYYAIILKDLDGREYNFIIPFKNATSHPVHVDNIAASGEVLASEEGSSEVFAPFISRLRANSDKNSVLLNWVDSSDVNGRNVIYRSTEEITNSNLKDAERVAEMPMGSGSFVDYPPDNREYYYAVLIKSVDGELYDYIIPFRNATSRPVNIETIASEEDLSTNVTHILASNEGDKIFISFSSSNPTREVLLYRHEKPINSAEELLKANLITKLPAGVMNYEDTPISGVPVYYGAFDAGMIMVNNFEFIPGENITFQPVEIEVSEKSAGRMAILPRAQPLPLLQIDSHVEDDKALSRSLSSTLPEYRELMPKTKKLVDQILMKMPLVKFIEMEPEVLDIDTASDSRGEQYTLFIIIDRYFNKSDWDKSETELNNFFRTNHSEGIEYRAHFYLAQVYYFQGRYQEAFLEFLLVKDEYYSNVEKWLDAVFRKLKNSE